MIGTELWLAYLSFALLVFALAPTRHLSAKIKWALLIALLVLGAIPFGQHQLPLSGYLRSLTDDIAITSLLWLAWLVWQRLHNRPVLRPAHFRQLTVCFAVAGLVLYPATLGLSAIDPYAWGYNPRPLLFAIAAIAIALWVLGNRFGSLLLCAATLAFAVDIKASSNYWDYLIDPFLWIYCVGAILRAGMVSASDKFRRWQLQETR